MLFSDYELDGQKDVIADLKEQIGKGVASIQTTLQQVEVAKGQIGKLQIQLMVEEKVLEKMVGQPKEAPKEETDAD